MIRVGKLIDMGKDSSGFRLRINTKLERVVVVFPDKESAAEYIPQNLQIREKVRISLRNSSKEPKNKVFIYDRNSDIPWENSDYELHSLERKI